VEDKIRGKGPETKSTSYKERRNEKFKHNITQNEFSESSEEEKRQKRKENARSIIAEARVNKSRHAWREENYEDDKKEMGALCFTRRVRKMRVPKGFNLPHDQQKYDGSQEPTLWLSDYLQVIRLQRIYNFLCSMLVFTPFAYCFVTLRGTFMHFPELTY
jgi:hypothetical protein